MNAYNLQRTLCEQYPRHCQDDDERVGAFWLPFLTGAVISAPLWYIIGNNKNQNQVQQYYPGYYPTYYPYPPQYPYR